ncbi:zonadhesin-like, partial [Phlebotomus argentipes]|uniref:zonadhesin-like n=1 Tax=Phlebotomus argentipes TaxID=94469 RepID=UPI0028930F58
MKCENRCHCIGNYKRINGVCQPPSKCKCPKNEEYKYANKCNEECGKSQSDCSNQKQYFDCFCKESFKRIGGVCVPDTKCECPENEEYVYGNKCDEDCSAKPGDCKDAECYKGCFCKDGFRRINGLCIPDTNCHCGKNEEYSNGNPCFEDCTKTLLECVAEDVYKRCNCLLGFKRVNGRCVPDTACKCKAHESYRYSSACEEQCNNGSLDCSQDLCYKGCFCDEGRNEEYTFGDRCHESCSENYDNCPQRETYRGCFCKEGFVRVNGMCQPFDKCPCNDNEVFTYGNSCEEECKYGDQDCAEESSSKGCFCDDGYVRINGLCVLGSNCGCGENEEYANSNECSEDCSKTWNDCREEPSAFRCVCLRHYKRIDGKCVKDVNCPCPENEFSGHSTECDETCGTTPDECGLITIINKCFCKPGYKRISGVCVEDSLCPCADNEEYTFGDRCQESCRENYDDCPQGETYRGCFCKEGFVRVNGICQTFDKCPCQGNEIFRYSSKCNEVCNDGTHDCTLETCTKGCFCEDAHVRINGICVPSSNCPCPENEEYIYSTDCLENCDIIWSECLNVASTFKCHCKRNHYRVNGKCVPQRECPCPNNEVYGFMNDCYETCGTTIQECAIINNNNKCYCDFGYKRIAGQCVPEDMCFCEDTEAEYKSGKACDDECIPPDDCPTHECFKACYCKEGFKKIGGVCKPESECLCPNDPNEEYIYSNTCLEKCDATPEMCRGRAIVAGCYCKEGFRRSDAGRCVLDSDCPCPDGEFEYKSGKACDDECIPPDDCPTHECFKACYCKEGFKKIGGVCKPESECLCPNDPNEEYIYSNTCLEKCDATPEMCRGRAIVAGCYCKEGFRRSDAGRCVLDSDCPCPDGEF